MPQQDAEASQVHEALEVLGVSFVSGDDSSKVLEPCEHAFDLPTTNVTAQRAAVLGLLFPIRPMRRDQFNMSFLPQSLIQSIAFVRLVADQSIGGHAEETRVDGFFNERDLSWRSTSNPGGDRKTRAVCNGHDLGPLAFLGFPDGRAPFLAPEKVPSMNASVMSSRPR